LNEVGCINNLMSSPTRGVGSGGATSNTCSHGSSNTHGCTFLPPPLLLCPLITVASTNNPGLFVVVVVVSSYLMHEHVHGLVERDTLAVGHGQEPEAHAHVEPLAHADPAERLRVFLGAGTLVLLGLTDACDRGGNNKSTQIPLNERRSDRLGFSKRARKGRRRFTAFTFVALASDCHRLYISTVSVVNWNGKCIGK